MSWPYRCTKERCKVRRALRKKKELYVREPTCDACGSPLRLDVYEQKQHKLKRCLCDGYHFPHRRGSKWCVHYTGVTTDEDWQDRRYASMR